MASSNQQIVCDKTLYAELTRRYLPNCTRFKRLSVSFKYWNTANMGASDIEKQPAATPLGYGDPKLLDPAGGSLPLDGEATYVNADRLARKLSARQVQMIAIGGTIGTGLFLGTGKALATGGPASMLIAYAICGGIVYVTMLSLGEMTAFIPVAGSFCTFAGLVPVHATLGAID